MGAPRSGTDSEDVPPLEPAVQAQHSARDPAVLWRVLDDIGLVAAFARRAPCLQSVPSFLRAGLRQAFGIEMHCMLCVTCAANDARCMNSELGDGSCCSLACAGQVCLWSPGGGFGST